MSKGIVVSYSPLLGGAERLLLDLLPAMPRGGTLACPAGPLADAAREAGFGWHELRPRRLELRGSTRDRAGAPLRIAAQARELRRLIRDTEPSWIVAWSMRAAMSAALACARGGPPALFQHNDFLPRGAAAGAVRWAAGRMDAVCALSQPVARDLDPRGRLGERLVILHPGVDLEHFAALPPAGGSRNVLLLGALVPWKRPDLALEAVAQAPDSRLLVAGAPIGDAQDPLLDRLRERAESPDLAGRVRFLGAMSDPRPALRESALLLHCADREPFGLVLAEALACGRPVVAPASGGPAEIVDSTCGRLYPPGDAEAAARAVSELLNDPALLARLSEGARRRAEQEFDLRGSRRRFKQFVERLPALA